MGYCDASVSGGSFGDIINTLDMMRTDAHKSVLREEDFKGATYEERPGVD
jgi:hypothetical protein